MEVVQTKAKKWGSSLGIVIPKDIVEKERIKEGEKLEVIVKKPVAVNTDKVFGSLKNWKTPTEKILKEVDEELWHE